MTLQQISKDTCIVRNTAAKKGRHLSIVPGSTASQYLHYGRIVLGKGDAALRVDTKDLETGLVCLRGSATVTVNGQPYALGRYDSLYVPKGTSMAIAPGADGCDLAEVAAPVEREYPIQFVKFTDVQKNPELRFNAGKETNQREVNILIGKNVEAGRIMAGVTFSAPGNWTSWPPHEHAAMLEEAYVYIDMPKPAYGVQLV
jgi:5-deoxy-glucuronate isomerase